MGKGIGEYNSPMGVELFLRTVSQFTRLENPELYQSCRVFAFWKVNSNLPTLSQALVTFQKGRPEIDFPNENDARELAVF